MSNSIRKYIRHILSEGVAYTGMSTEQWWESVLKDEYNGPLGDERHYVYTDDKGNQVIGKKRSRGDPYTYEDLGDGKYRVVSGPTKKSIGSIVSKPGSSEASAATSDAGQQGQAVPAKPSAIADYIKKMSAGLADMLGVIERLEELRTALATGQGQGLNISKDQRQKLFSEKDMIETFISLQVAVPIAGAFKAVSAIAQGNPAEMPQFGTPTGALAQADPKIAQLIASGGKNIKDAIKSLKGAMREKGVLSSLSESDKKLFRDIASEIMFTAKSVNIAAGVPFAGAYEAGPLGVTYITGSSIYYADNAHSSDVKARADRLRVISGTA